MIKMTRNGEIPKEEKNKERLRYYESFTKNYVLDVLSFVGEKREY